MSISSTFKKHGRWKGCLVILLYLLLSLLELFVVSLYLLFRFAQDTYRKMAKKRSQKKRRKSRAKSIFVFNFLRIAEVIGRVFASSSMRLMGNE
ncbi:MAG: hypothetical protein D3913_13935 [Candidatus Electrothrix sp. LOE1_4_5]|nr:hypothetical protein [Candidatus Electrothrix gigas]